MKSNYQTRKISGLSMGPLQKAMLGLTYLGEKPACELELFSHNAEPEYVRSLLKLMGLYVLPIAPSSNESKKHVASFAISKYETQARLLATICCDHNHSQQLPQHIFDQMYGALMGYPSSAIHGFVNNKMLPAKTSPESIFDLLSVFRFSEESWQEETEVVEKWKSILKETFPEIMKDLSICF